MRMRSAVLVRQPLRQDDIEAGLGRIAGQDCVLRAAAGRHPLDVLGKLNVDGFGIEFGRLDRSKRDECRYQREMDGPPDGDVRKHGFLLEFGIGDCIPPYDSITITTSPISTTSPGLKRISEMRPATGATRMLSIFMDSMIA